MMHVEQSTCPSCGSGDAFFAVESADMQGLKIVTSRQYCNPCPYEERWIRVEGIQVFHDVADGNVTRVVTPERR